MCFKTALKKFLFKTVITMFRVTVVNPEKEPNDGVLICSNHISNLDPVMIVTSFKNKVSFMAKKELFKIPVVGAVIRAFGAFPVDRGSVDMNTIKTAISLLKNGSTVGMFPQGRRMSGVLPSESVPKSGAGMIIVRSHADVLPVAVIMKNNKYRLGTKAYIVIGDVIKFESLSSGERTKEEFNRVSSYIFDKICKLYNDYSYLAESKKQ